MSFTGVQRVLVIKLAHIGDVLLTAPVFRALRESFPRAELFALVNKGTDAMLDGHPLIREVLTFDRAVRDLGAFRKAWRQAAFLRQVRGLGVDMVVDLTCGDRSAFISRVSGARYRLSFTPKKKGWFGKRHLYTHMVPRDWNLHTVLQHLSVVEAFGIATREPVVDFAIPEAARARIRELLRSRGVTPGDRIVHIHPPSRWLFKCWADASMAQTIEWLLAQGLTVAVTAAPDPKELERNRAILSQLAPHPALIDLSGETNLKELAALSELSELFLGVDSAPMHIAAALGVPVVALFGPTGAYNWGPWPNSADFPDPKTPYPGQNGTRAFGPHIVLQDVRECIPCGEDGCNGTKRSDCLHAISVERVCEALAAVFAQTPLSRSRLP